MHDPHFHIKKKWLQGPLGLTCWGEFLSWIKPLLIKQGSSPNADIQSSMSCSNWWRLVWVDFLISFFPRCKNTMVVGHDTGVRRLPGSIHCLEFDMYRGAVWGGADKKEKQKSSDGVGGGKWQLFRWEIVRRKGEGALSRADPSQILKSPQLSQSHPCSTSQRRHWQKNLQKNKGDT